jgi:4-hydroxyphenylacetate 3-monooxygenase
VKELTESILASGLIYINSHAVDFRAPALRPYLDKYLRGSDGTGAVDRIKLMKLLWDAIGTEFGGRHELYERNYAGAAETIRVVSWRYQASGQAAGSRGFAEQWPSTTSTADRPRPHHPRRRQPLPEEEGLADGFLTG